MPQCPHCKKEVSKKSLVCYNCGKPLKDDKGLNVLVIVLIVILVAIVLLFVFYGFFFPSSLDRAPVPSVTYVHTQEPTSAPPASPSPVPTPTPEPKLAGDYGLVDAAERYGDMVQSLNGQFAAAAKESLDGLEIPLVQEIDVTGYEQVRHQLSGTLSLTFYFAGDEKYVRAVTLMANLPQTKDEEALLDCYVPQLMELVKASVDTISETLETSKWYKRVEDRWIHGDSGGIHVYEQNDIFYLELTFADTNPWE